MTKSSTSTRGPGIHRVWRPFEEARAWVRAKGFASWREWRRFCTADDHKNVPGDIPFRPDRAYPDKWVSWCDWLGLPEVVRRKHRQLPNAAPQAEWIAPKASGNSTIRMVTPDQATKFLSVGVLRKPNKSVALRYARLISKGQLPVMHQGVVIDRSKRVVSGIEILEAIAISGLATEIKLTTGEDPDNARKYGLAKPRNIRDTLKVVMGVATVDAAAVLQRIAISCGLGMDPNDRVLTVEVYKAFQSELEDTGKWSRPEGDRGLWRSWARGAVLFAMCVPGIKTRAREIGQQLLGLKSPERCVSELRARLLASEPRKSARELFSSTLCNIVELCRGERVSFDKIVEEVVNARRLSTAIATTTNCSK